jgi:hypothetical protein
VGDAFTTSGSFADPGADVWSATVDYGDGSGLLPLPLVGNTFALGRVFDVPGAFVVTVTISDESGGVGTAQTTVWVPGLLGPYSYP